MIIAGVHEPTLAEATRCRRKYGKTQPLLNAMLAVIKEAGGTSKDVEQLLDYMKQKVPAHPVTDNHFEEAGLGGMRDIARSS